MLFFSQSQFRKTCLIKILENQMASISYHSRTSILQVRCRYSSVLNNDYQYLFILTKLVLFLKLIMNVVFTYFLYFLSQIFKQFIQIFYLFCLNCSQVWYPRFALFVPRSGPWIQVWSQVWLGQVKILTMNFLIRKYF